MVAWKKIGKMCQSFQAQTHVQTGEVVRSITPLVSQFAEPFVQLICLPTLFLTDWDTVLPVLLGFIGMGGRRPQHEAVNMI